MEKNALNHSIQSLRHLMDQFDDLSIKSWIDFGTLLGAYREKSIIGHDYDMDICVLTRDASKVTSVIERLLIEKKIIQIAGGTWDEKHSYQFAFNHTPLRVDVFFCQEKSNKIIPCFSEQFSFRSFYIDELETIPLGDSSFHCPRHLESFLELRYGKDYMTPQKRCFALDLEWEAVMQNVGSEKNSYSAYTSGVYDLFHVGHLNLFKRMKEHFDKVIVGVHTDEDVCTYKPKPTMTYNQRLETVQSCAYVDEVYESAELITTDALLDKVGADYVVAGRDPGMHIEKFYPVSPHRLHLIARTPGVCSSELRKRSME